jgi:putative intracellular protease/amidase
MKIKKGPKPWQPKIMVENEKEEKAVTLLKDYNSELTAILAFAALFTGTLTILFLPSLQWVRWTFSLITFLAAIVTTGRYVTASARVTGTATVTAEATVVKKDTENQEDT